MMHPSRRLLLATAAIATSLYLLFSLAVHLHWLDSADLRMHRWVVANMGPTLLGVRWMDLTSVGVGAVSTLVAGLAALLAWRAGAGRTAAVIVGFALLGGAIVLGAKALHARPYPGGGHLEVVLDGNGTACGEFGRCHVAMDRNTTLYCPGRCTVYLYNGTELVEVRTVAGTTDLSTFPTRPGRAYPSGHTIGATVSWGVALLLGTRAVQRSRGFDPWAVGVWAVVALVGGVSRIPVQSHWWTDVVGSWFLGVALVAAAVLADDAWGRRGKDAPDPPWRLRL